MACLLRLLCLLSSGASGVYSAERSRVANLKGAACCCLAAAQVLDN